MRSLRRRCTGKSGSVAVAITGTLRAQWEPLHRALREDDRALQRRLVRLRDAAGLPTEVSTLRAFDVICWREGKDLGL